MRSELVSIFNRTLPCLSKCQKYRLLVYVFEKSLLDNIAYEDSCHGIFEHVITRFRTKDAL